MPLSKESNGLFVRVVVTITSVLIVAGITASIALAFQTSKQIALLEQGQKNQLKNYADHLVKFEALIEEHDETKELVKTLKLLLDPHTNNHTEIRKDFESILKRLKELEDKRNE